MTQLTFNLDSRLTLVFHRPWWKRHGWEAHLITSVPGNPFTSTSKKKLEPTLAWEIDHEMRVTGTLHPLSLARIVRIVSSADDSSFSVRRKKESE